MLDEHIADLLDVDVPSPQTIRGSERNPWAGASRRLRFDLIAAATGCGGTYKPAARRDMQIDLQFVTLKQGRVVDSTPGSGPAVIRLGAGQVTRRIEHALYGLCAGDIVGLSIDWSTYMIVHIVQVYSVSAIPANNERLDLDDMAKRIVPTPARQGSSCKSVCERNDMRCEPDGFPILNSCPRLRSAFDCTSCEIAAKGTAGPDMPCFVSTRAPDEYPRGFCMVHPDATKSRCDGKHKYTKRLCPCIVT